ncbi:MAG: 3-oxoacyl-ACP synthase, partial [Calditrichaeota bacterium]|nr:3-oxoacyl-ACP synthase [Calditrichota bacterium]
MKNAAIIGLGHYLPDRVVTNNDLEKLMETSDEWIQERTGIVTRRWMTENDTIGSMSHAAAQMALENAGLQAADIDCIIFATLISDHVF